MARLNPRPIGAPLNDQTDVTEQMNALHRELHERRTTLRAGWGDKYQERTRARGKMTVWERVDAMIDPGTEAMPVGTFVNDGETFGEERKTSPSAGVVTVFGRVAGRWVVIIANDNTVASGSWWPRTPEKIIRAQNMALRLGLPVAYLVDCSGLFLPEQGRVFAGQGGSGHIFAMNSRLSAAGVPQVAGVFGDCIAGGGYMPIISDHVVMTEQAYMVIAGAALIRGAKSQNLSSRDIGGADVHVHLSGCADERVPDDALCIRRLRELISQTAGPATDFYRQAAPSEPGYDPMELLKVLPVRSSEPYDVRQVIARLVDDSFFHEFMPSFGQEVITGVARISGLNVAICANLQGLFDHPTVAGRKRAGGILYREGVAKLAIFSRACNDDGIPIVWLQDISGFDIGEEAEKQGLLAYGSSLIYTNSTNQTPMFTVLLRKASGAGYFAMAGLPYEPIVQLSTPLARQGVMEGKTLAIGAFRTRLDDEFNIIAGTDDEREQIAAAMRAVEDRIDDDMNPYRAGARMDTDEVVGVDELRAWLVALAEMAYQAQGRRRIKNPRIWSLHDLNRLAPEAV
jgi:acetyl-CoA carboxylase carboxyltransferase component